MRYCPNHLSTGIWHSASSFTHHFCFIHQERVEFFELWVLAQNFLRHVELPRKTTWIPAFASVLWPFQDRIGKPGYLCRRRDCFTLELEVCEIRNVGVPDDVVQSASDSVSPLATETGIQTWGTQLATSGDSEGCRQRLPQGVQKGVPLVIRHNGLGLVVQLEKGVVHGTFVNGGRPVSVAAIPRSPTSVTSTVGFSLWNNYGQCGSGDERVGQPFPEPCRRGAGEDEFRSRG